MSQYSEDDIDVITDVRHLVAAASAVARLDEAVKHAPSADALFYPSLVRAEALNIAALEGSLVRVEALCRLLGEREATNLDRSVRLAADIHDTLEWVRTWDMEPPSAEMVRELFDRADKSSGRRLKQDLVWVLEGDCQWLHDELLAFSEQPNPWEALETLRSLWISGRFLGTARRMALVCSSWIIARGFGCDTPVIGLAAQISKDAEGFRNAGQERLAWIVAVSGALTELGRDGMKRIGDGAASKMSMLALCPPERASSSVEKAIEYMMKTPVFRSASFAEALNLQARGAKVVLDKLEAADVVEVDGGLRNRNFVCRRAM